MLIDVLIVGPYFPSALLKRQGAGALQDASRIQERYADAPALGVRQPSAAFMFSKYLKSYFCELEAIKSFSTWRPSGFWLKLGT